MNTIQQLKEELQEEYSITKKFMERYPDGQNDYAPHEKSMKMKPLVEHITDLFGWAAFIGKTDKLDFADTPYEPKKSNNRVELLLAMDAGYQASVDTLNQIDESELNKSWTLEHNKHILAKWNKYGAIRHSLNQITHHRAQLGIYYRLLGIPVPGSYGPTADENNF